LTPTNPTPSICTDLLDDSSLLAQLAAHAGPSGSLALVPYVSTPAFLDLAARLRNGFGLTVLSPESPAPNALWLRDYADRKAGFRWLAPDAPFPEGYVCRDTIEGAAVARWFLEAGRACIVKPDSGNSGFGQLVLRPGDDPAKLAADPFLGRDQMIVEEFVTSSTFPSVEYFVPPLGDGPPRLTYACLQILRGSHFAGVIIDRDQREAGWYQPLVAAGERIAARLQRGGYTGCFDLDAVVDRDGGTLLLELNARRTGGTHAHELAGFLLGPDYLSHAAVICHAELACPSCASFEALHAALAPLLYPLGGERRGLVITNCPAAEDRTFGCTILGRDAQDAAVLEGDMFARIGV
jgi:hypothetical protein